MVTNLAWKVYVYDYSLVCGVLVALFHNSERSATCEKNTPQVVGGRHWSQILLLKKM